MMTVLMELSLRLGPNLCINVANVPNQGHIDRNLLDIGLSHFIK